MAAAPGEPLPVLLPLAAIAAARGVLSGVLSGVRGVPGVEGSADGRGVPAAPLDGDSDAIDRSRARRMARSWASVSDSSDESPPKASLEASESLSPPETTDDTRDMPVENMLGARPRLTTALMPLTALGARSLRVGTGSALLLPALLAAPDRGVDEAPAATASSSPPPPLGITATAWCSAGGGGDATATASRPPVRSNSSSESLASAARITFDGVRGGRRVGGLAARTASSCGDGGDGDGDGDGLEGVSCSDAADRAGGSGAVPVTSEPSAAWSRRSAFARGPLPG